MPAKVHPISKDLEAQRASAHRASFKQNGEEKMTCEKLCCDNLFGKNCCRTTLVIVVFMFVGIYIATVLSLSLNNQNTTLF